MGGSFHARSRAPGGHVVTLRNHAEDLFEVIIHGGLLPLLLNMLRRIDGTGQR